MAGHNAPSMQKQSFFFLTIGKAIYQNILVSRSDKKIDPVYHSKTYKVWIGLIPDFIFAAQLLVLFYSGLNSKIDDIL
jgi:membrane-anchored glycerophosphoryl diester phosphodiesterase (GDPDase)